MKKIHRRIREREKNESVLAVREKPRDFEMIDGGGCAPPWKNGMENWSLLVVDVFGRYCSGPLFADDSDVVMSAMAQRLFKSSFFYLLSVCPHIALLLSKTI